MSQAWDRLWTRLETRAGQGLEIESSHFARNKKVLRAQRTRRSKVVTNLSFCSEKQKVLSASRNLGKVLISSIVGLNNYESPIWGQKRFE